jgi:hypothetical protein
MENRLGKLRRSLRQGPKGQSPCGSCGNGDQTAGDHRSLGNSQYQPELPKPRPLFAATYINPLFLLKGPKCTRTQYAAKIRPVSECPHILVHQIRLMSCMPCPEACRPNLKQASRARHMAAQHDSPRSLTHTG